MSFKNDLSSGTISGLIAGGIIGLVTFVATQSLEERQAASSQLFEERLAQSQTRLENLRFVRQIAMSSDEVVMQFRGLDLQEMNLGGLDLSCRDTSPGDFCTHSVDLSGANLKSASLAQTNLLWTDLSESNLTGADLTGANLRGAILTGTNLSGVKLEHVCVDGTEWPAGYPIPNSDKEVCDYWIQFQDQKFESFFKKTQ